MAILKKKKQAEAEEVKTTEATAAAATEKVEKKAKKTTKKAEDKKESKKARAISTLAMRTILAPLATEKSAALAEKNVYVFLVAQDANRVAVKQAVRELYKVTPIKVNIVNVRGKAKRFGRFVGRRSDMKKALVTLPQGSHIDLFETV